MATYNLGRILPVFRGAFNSEESYNRLDVVYVSGYGSYVCSTDNTTTSPVNDSTNWVLLNRDITNAQAWDEFVVFRRERHHSCSGHKHPGNRSENRIGITNLSQLHQRRCQQEKRPKPRRLHSKRGV